MQRTLRTIAILAIICLLGSGFALAQTGAFSGKVTGADGKPLQNALVKIERKDIKGNYQVKTNKKGEYFHAGLPLGNYDLSVLVGDKVMDKVLNVRTSLGDPKEINFDLQAIARKQEAMQRAAETGQVTQEMARDMTPEQKAAWERQAKERSAQMAKNKALNDAFNTGMTAIQAKDYPTAIDALKKAGEMDPKQNVVWANLAEAYVGLSASQAGPERDASLQGASDAYLKAIELKPDDAGLHNNYGLALVRMKKIPEATAELTKAAQLDPPGGGKYFFNLGAVMVNTGQNDAAVDAFKKAVEMDPNYADAWYYLGNVLSGKMTMTADGKPVPPPGMKEALEKYLALRPDGPHAEASKGLLSVISSTLETSYTNPDAKKSTSKKTKK